jgi:hypothetical protein
MLSKVQKKSELEKIESNILCKLNQIPNFNSDLYQPLSLAIQMINLKKQDIYNSNQFIINILLASASLITALVFGIIQLCK